MTNTYLGGARMGEITPATKPDAYTRFLSRVDASGGPDACHVWTGARDSRGYGHIRQGGKVHRAPRWLLGYLRGKPLEPGEQALHRCDNPPCVNPRHLYVGDRSQNMQDMVARNRRVNGNSRKTHCPRGHLYDEANTYVNRKRGSRHCRACRRIAKRESQQAGRAA